METDLNKRFQTLLALWFALSMSVAMFFALSLFVSARIINEPGNQPRSLLILALTAPGMLLVIISFVLKNRVLARAVEKQEIGLVQQALVMACAMCEASALLGVVEYFLIGGREYYLLFGLAAGGLALHFPRRSHLEAASYGTRNTL